MPPGLGFKDRCVYRSTKGVTRREMGSPMASRKRENQWQPKNANTQDQRQRFIQAARALGCDKDEIAFKERLSRIARVKPKERPNRANNEE